LARKYQIDAGFASKYAVISRWQSYHGSTNGALSWSGFTSRRADFLPYLRDFSHIPPAYCYRCWYGQKSETCDLQCADALENEILCMGPETVSAFIAEPVSGTSLCAARPPAEYFRRVRSICDKYGVLLILDEVMSGMGRTGKYFAHEHFGVLPDIMALGKGVSGGYFPLAGAMCTAKVTDTIAEKSGIFGVGHSWAGNPLGCAVGLKVLEILERDHLVERCASMGQVLESRLQALAAHPTVGDLRGIGLMRGIEFVKDKATKETLDPRMHFSHQLFDEALKRGVVVQPSSGCNRGQSGDMIMLGPPFIITESQIDELVAGIDEALWAVEKRNGLA
jgi:adenosylmethionine-8-amino-7-oxononanoate aminotransferase